MRLDRAGAPREAPGQVAESPAPDPHLLAEPLDPRAVIALQRSAGNWSVSRMLSPSAPDAQAGLGALAKVQGDEAEFVPDEAAGDDRVTVLTVETGDGDGPSGSEQATVSVQATPASPGSELEHSASHGFAKCGATAAASIASGATPSHALSAGMYGLTFPESVDVTITACKEAGKWVPGVVALVGKYSMQTRLLPGQTEVTGPGGNTNAGNFCSQVRGLTHLGNITSNPWYMLSAVVAHEQVHEKRFLPAMNAVSAKIATAVEAVSISDDGKMTEAEALVALKADPAFKAAARTAYTTWLAEAATRVAGDHAGGGPTDRAERVVVDPMIASICAEAKKRSWRACADCP